jgi:uncharacterized protein
MRRVAQDEAVVTQPWRSTAPLPAVVLGGSKAGPTRLEPTEMAAHDYVVRDNPEELRYEILDEGRLVGAILYRTAPGVVVLVHTEVEPSAEGHGVGSRLVGGALADIRTRGLRVAPVCPFVADYLRLHPDQRDLVVADPAIPE